MAKLTADMEEMFRNQLPVLATASLDRIPNVVPKSSMQVLDNETLFYVEGAGEKTLKNLQQNPKVAVMVADRDKMRGYQIKGTAELLTSGDLFQRAVKITEEAKLPRPKCAVRIRIEAIYTV